MPGLSKPRLSKPRLSKKDKRLSKKGGAPAIEPGGEWRAWIRRVVEHPVTSYVAILLFQLKAIWGMWWYKDLTSGDTLAYFLNGVGWFRDGTTSFVWSPIYCAFIGELFHISSDAYTIVTLHRVLIVLALAALVLALMRRLLPPLLAWMIAAWWVVLPIDFNALYEVHLFAVIPLLLAALAILWKPGAWGRGSAIAILAADGLLVRNENLAAAGLLAVLSLGYEAWRSREDPASRPAFKDIAMAYGVPMLSSLLVALFFFVHRSPSDSWGLMAAKHDVNVCQVFAAGYQQRANDFELSPWTECGQLMQRVFGASSISMMDALRANRSAMLGHFWWNIRLLPAGLEVLLFNFRSGGANPDYANTYQSGWVLLPSLGACALLALGAYLFFSERKQWMETWRSRYSPFWGSALESWIWAWIALVCVSLVVGGAILTNRPRPSYMFILGIAIRALLGLCFYLVLRRWPRLRTAFAAVALLAVAAALIRPSVFEGASRSTRPLLQAYRRLQPFERFFHEPNHLLVSTEFGSEISSYDGKCNCPWVRFDELRAKVTPERGLEQVFDEAGATLFLADERILTDPVAQQFVMRAGQYHWEMAAGSLTLRDHWVVLHRQR
jgi:hypothetical protein